MAGVLKRKKMKVPKAKAKLFFVLFVKLCESFVLRAEGTDFVIQLLNVDDGRRGF
jgi:hypothetical protein